MIKKERFLFRAQTRAVLPRGVVLHASSVETDGRAAVFLAPSTGGKSTIAYNLSNRNGFFFLADDTVIVADGSNGKTRCLPCGSLKINSGREEIAPAELGVFVFLEKGTNTSLVKLSPLYATYRAIRTGSIIGAEDLSIKEREQTRSYLRNIFTVSPPYLLRYSLSNDPAQLIRELLQ